MQTAHPRCLISKFRFLPISRCSPVEYRDFAISQRSFVLNHRRIVHGSRTISMSIYDRKGGKLCFVKRKDNVFLSDDRVMFEEKVWIFRVLPFWIKKVVDFLSKSPFFHFLLPCFHFLLPNFLDKPPSFLTQLPHFHIEPPSLTGNAMHFSLLLILSAPPLRV